MKLSEIRAIIKEEVQNRFLHLHAAEIRQKDGKRIYNILDKNKIQLPAYAKNIHENDLWKTIKQIADKFQIDYNNVTVSLKWKHGKQQSPKYWNAQIKTWVSM